MIEEKEEEKEYPSEKDFVFFNPDAMNALLPTIHLNAHNILEKPPVRPNKKIKLEHVEEEKIPELSHEKLEKGLFRIDISWFPYTNPNATPMSYPVPLPTEETDKDVI